MYGAENREDLFPKNRLISEVFREEKNFRITVIHDRSFLDFGTKYRRFNGIIKSLYDTDKKITVQGNPNSNFMSSFAVLFRMYGFKIRSLCFSRSDKKSLSFRLTERFSDQFELFCDRKLFLERREEISQDKNSILLPEYGMNPDSEKGLHSLWTDIQKIIEKGTLILDAGSGLTYLSALKNIHSSGLSLCAVSLGEKKEKMEKRLSSYWREFFPKENEPTFHLIRPATCASFGSANRELQNFIQNESDKGFHLEPMYSAKTVYTILKLAEQGALSGSIYYLHQGGRLNHWRLFWA